MHQKKPVLWPVVLVVLYSALLEVTTGYRVFSCYTAVIQFYSSFLYDESFYKGLGKIWIVSFEK